MLKRYKTKKYAFSLVEMLMALLVASLLLAALAPVMTRKMNENIHITGEFSHKGNSKIVEIDYGGPYCNRIERDAEGNELYCEGEYEIDEGFSNVTVTAIGAGGGGGTAPTAGYIEYTKAGSTNEFKVPAMVDKIEATLIGGGAGGGAGGKEENSTSFTTEGLKNWTPPGALLNASDKYKYVKITGCGGGGGAAGSRGESHSLTYGGGGGSGAYGSTILNIANASKWDIHIGGGGGGGAPYGCHNGYNGGYYAGGGGGGGYNGKTGGSGGMIGTNTGGTGGNACSSPDRIFDGLMRQFGTDGESASPANGGKGGAQATLTENQYTADYGGGGGSGGTVAGGGGGGGVLGTSAGGGGGAPTRIVIDGAEKLVWPGGGGGGAGTFCNAAAGITEWCYQGGGGGGGGGIGGGKGGDATYSYWQHGAKNGIGGSGGANSMFATHADGTTGQGGVISGSVFETSNCSGGNAFTVMGIHYGNNGKPGGIKIQYPKNRSGGGGGGGGAIVPYRELTVSPLKTLSISVADRASGGTPGGYTASGEFVDGNYADAGKHTEITEDGVTLLHTFVGHWTHRGNHYGTGCCANCPKGKTLPEGADSRAGAITNGRDFTGGCLGTTCFGASNTHGLGANNVAAFGQCSLGDTDSDGGRGGYVSVFGKQFCTPGEGGNASHPDGYDAQDPGCGGGGGSRGGRGGSGSGGYARLSWNMYWNSTNNVYEISSPGAGGGGAGGNIIKTSLRVQEKQVIRIRIGAGGIGARVVNNEIIPATSGGTTIFGSEEFIQVKAGGGGGGVSPVIKNGKITKGEGGKHSNICSVGSKNYIDNESYCTKGNEENTTPAGDENNAPQGGLGAAFSYTFNNKTYIGQGGTGGVQSTEETNSKGKNGEGTGAGGGGAALLIRNQVSNLSELSHPQGGKGANGKIILQLWE